MNISFLKLEIFIPETHLDDFRDYEDAEDYLENPGFTAPFPLSGS